MVNVTFSVPEKVHKVMKAHSEIRWTELARRPVVELAEKLSDKETPDFVKLLRQERFREQNSLLEKTNNNSEQALRLWAEEIKKRRKKTRLPSWWKNASSSL